MADPKLPPFSLEAEQSVLGGLMLRPQAFDDVATILGAEDFYRQAHQEIWRAVEALGRANAAIDMLTVTDWLRRAGALDLAGGFSAVAELAGNTPSAANVVAYARIVREKAVLRSLVAAGGDIADMAYRPEGREPSALLDAAESRLTEIRNRSARGQGDAVDMADLVARANVEIERRSKGEELLGLSTGFADLDQLTTGLHPGDLVIVAGRPSMGKTSFAMNIAEYVAVREGKPALVFSMEMPAEQLALRSLSTVGRIPMQAVRTGRMDQAQMDAHTYATGALSDAPLRVDDSGGLTPMDLRARARRQAKRGLSLIVVDYIQLMQCPGHDNRTNEIAEISRNLKALAKELRVPIIVVSQLNRGVEQRDNKRPRMSDLRESGGIEQDADLILFVYRDEVYNANSPDAGTAEIIISKQRNGPLGMVRLAFLGEMCLFENLAHGWQPAVVEQPTKRRGFGGMRGMSHAAHAVAEEA